MQTFPRRAQRRPRLTQRQKLQRKITAFSQSSMGNWIFGEVRKAKTVQVLTGNDLTGLNELYRLKRDCSIFSGYDYGKPTGLYHMSHIFSRAGNKTHIGLLRSDNLVIADGLMNKKRAKHEEAVDGRGSAIPRNSLQMRFACDEKTTNTEIIKKIRTLLGKEFDKFLLLNTFSPNLKNVLLKKAKKYAVVDSKWSLERLKQVVEDNGESCGGGVGKPIPVHIVLKHELERLRLTGHWTYWIVSQQCQPMNHLAQLPHRSALNHLEFTYSQAFAVLHQQQVEYFNNGIAPLDAFRIPCYYKNSADLHTVITPLDMHCVVNELYSAAVGSFDYDYFYTRAPF